VYGPLFGPAGRTLFSLSEGRSFYVGSLSKVLAPGLRIGFIVAPEARTGEVTDIVRATSLSRSTLSAEFVVDFMRRGFAEETLAWHRNEIRSRHAITTETLAGYEVATAPGCYHVWLRLPGNPPLDELIVAAREYGILLTDSAIFQMARQEASNGI